MNHKLGFAIVGLALIASAAWIMLSGNEDGGGFDVTMAFKNHGCNTETHILSKAIDVVKEADGQPIAQLSPGTPIYLCQQEGDFRRVLYPQAGSSADCTLRTSNYCRHGLVIHPVPVDLAG